MERSVRKNRPARNILKPPVPNLHICGRLDRDSEGLLLLTDDGNFTAKVCGASCPKVYWALIQNAGGTKGNLDTALSRMRRGGLNIRGKRTRPPVAVTQIDPPTNLPPPAPGMVARSSNSYWIEIILTEGKNRQIRRITGDAGYKTIRLVRVAIGDLSLPSLLLPGDYQRIRREDVLVL